MDLLDRLLHHDSWTTQQLLERARELTDAQLDQDFDIGHRTLRATFSHVIRNVETWGLAMAGALNLSTSVVDSANADGVIQLNDDINELTERLSIASKRLQKVARRISDLDAWDERWLDSFDNLKKSYGGAVAHVITHSMHHRAQLLYLLRLLGVNDLPEGDVFSWENQFAETETN